MNVVFIHRGGESMASFRYRTLLPAKQIGHINGMECSINSGAADILVLSKPCPEDVQLLREAKKDGAKVIADFCDDHFNHPQFSLPYRTIAAEADRVVAGTTVMADRIKGYVGRSVDAVIGDSYEEEETEPHAVGEKLLWFGHNLNLPDLKPWLDSARKWDFTICTGPKLVRDTQCVQWTLKHQGEELRKANVVMLPSRPGAEYKTNNRLLNTIRAGCFPVATLHPAYEDFRKLVWVGDIRTGLNWCKAFPEDLNGLVKEAQAYIRDRYSPAAVAKQWAQLLEAA